MNEIEQRKVKCYDLLRQIYKAQAVIQECQTEITHLGDEINHLEQSNG